MPELPEVETTRRGIEPHLVGRTVTHVIVRQPALRWPVSEDLAQCLIGKKILQVNRRAKYLLLDTGAGSVMIHLGMSGSLLISPLRTPAGKHDHLDFIIDQDTLLRYRDPRRFGSVFWLPESEHVLLEHLGPEPLSEDFTGETLWRLARNRKVAVKLFIMNSHIVVGVGNIYANEALYRAGIRPGIAAGRVTRPRFDKLVRCIRQVLSEAIAAGGTTLQDFVREDGSHGYFSQSLAVYGRAGLACKGCRGVLKEIRQAGRTTVYCPTCQN